MKKFYTAFLLLLSAVSFGQVPAYYNGIDFSQSGSSIHTQLTNLVTTTHNEITYDNVWNCLKVADLETGSSTLVTLIYGYNDGDGNPVTDRTRSKDLNGGAVGEWNREHVFPKSIGNPDLGTSGPGSDAHNLRASDVQQNGNRDNRLFANGSGNAGNQGANWYPGDEWKGDCARIVMYMYLRYGTRCTPTAVGVGTTNALDANMCDLFLEWNTDDPVSQFEKDRNNAIQNCQGNRNPFIDNPKIATKIWGGPPAEDTWGGLGDQTLEYQAIKVYPVPVSGDILYVSGLNTLELEDAEIYSMNGQLIQDINLDELVNNGGVSIGSYPQGTYILFLIFENQVVQRKVIVE